MLDSWNRFIPSNKTVKLFSYISLILLITSVWFTYYTWDDYKFLAAYKEYGFWGMMKKLILNDDGRFASLVSITHLSLMLVIIKNIKIYLLLHLSILFINSYLVVKIISILRNNGKFLSGYPVLIFFTIFYWLGNYYYGSIADTLYWGTGAGYNYFNLTALLWIYFMLKSKEQPNDNWLLVKIFGLSILAGNTSPHIILGLLGLNGIEFFTARNSFRRKLLFISSVGLITGFVYLFFVHGTVSRMVPYKPAGGYTILGLMKGYFIVINKYFHFYIVFFILFMLIILVNYKAINKSKFYKLRFDLHNTAFYISKFRYLIALLLSLTTFSILPSQASGRTSCFGSYLLLIQFFCMFNVEANKNSMKLIFTSVFILFSVLILKNMHDEYFLYNEIKQREALLKGSYGQNVVLKPISSRIPAIYKFVDISRDPSYPMNKCEALFYNVESIRIDSISK